MKKLHAAGFLLLLTAAACKPNDDTQPEAGKGGSTSMRVFAQHHGARVDSFKVYIRYNAQNAPGDGRYDDSVQSQALGNGLAPAAIFPGLRPGNYYLFGRGWDPQISQVVRGGSPFTIPDNKVTHEVYLPVGEE